MKKQLTTSLLIFSMISLIVFSFQVVAAPMGEMIVVENHSFELPGTEKQTNFENVPGWSTDTPATDSGVETG